MTGYIIATGGGHLGDGMLMQLLDEPAATAPEARDHLATCADCLARYTTLNRAASLLRRSLPDHPMPAIALDVPKKRRPWAMPVPIAAAATFVVLASAAAATPPVRNWIRNHVIGQPTVVTPVANPPIAPPAVATAGVVASFVPTDTALVIRFNQRQSRGALLLKVADSDRISAQAVGGTAAEEMVVLPGQLRVVNTSSSVADYRVTVPTSVRAVRVMIGDSEIVVLRTTSGLERRIGLR